MHDQTVHIVSQAIRYMEDHLHDKLDLETVAAALFQIPSAPDFYKDNRLDDPRICRKTAAHGSGKASDIFRKTDYGNCFAERI